MKRKILVVDIGGTYVKLLMSRRVEREFASGPRMGPAEFVNRFKQNVRGWNFDVVSIGFPAPVRNGRITRDPKHLGRGWVRFNFARALGIPVRVVNGGGLVHRLRQLPKGTERGRNENAFLGGIRLWEIERNSRDLKWRML